MTKIKDTFLHEKDITVETLRKDKTKLEYFIRDYNRYKALSSDRLLIISKIFITLNNFQKENPNIILKELEESILKIVNNWK